MSALLRAFMSRTAPSVRQQRMNLYTRPAKDKIGPVESAVGIGLFSLAILGPAGWILSHLEDYKKSE